MITCGDCLEVMRGMEPNSVDSIVTDPPYGLEFMGKEWDTFGRNSPPSFEHSMQNKFKGFKPLPRPGGLKYEGMVHLQEWATKWAVEALRVAKPGAHLLAFGGTRTFHRLTCAIEDAGWEIRDCLGWLYGSGFPKSRNLKGEHEGWGTALKPAWEPIILARKPLDGTVAANVLKWGTGAINVDGCRVPMAGKKGYWPGEDYGDHAGVATGFHRGKGQENAQGRWPANLITDGSEEVLELFPNVGSGRGYKPRSNNRTAMQFDPKNGWNQHSMDPNNANAPDDYGDSGSAARFFYCAKASRKEREMGCEGMEEIVFQSGCVGAMPIDDAGNERDRFKVKAKNHHPTVKPLALMRYLCRLVTPPNGLILDPFAGSGTTLIAAEQEGFRAVGIELNQEYCEIAKRRTNETL